MVVSSEWYTLREQHHSTDCYPVNLSNKLLQCCGADGKCTPGRIDGWNMMSSLRCQGSQGT